VSALEQKAAGVVVDIGFDEQNVAQLGRRDLHGIGLLAGIMPWIA